VSEYASSAPLGLDHFPDGTHGVRRGLFILPPLRGYKLLPLFT